MMKTSIQKLRLLIATIALAFTASESAFSQESPYFAQVGYAAATGGAGGTTYTITSFSDLQTRASASGAAILRITGALNGGGETVEIASNKTIIGEGASGEISNATLQVSGSSNVIIRNLKIHHAPDGGDLITIIDAATKVWVDHCEFYNSGIVGGKDDVDGLLDVTRGAENITISWNYFHDHWKGLLVGSSDSDLNDWRISFHHNRFQNVFSRLPSYRDGTGHIFNNYFQDTPTDPSGSRGTGINSRMTACLKIEGNVFENFISPIHSKDSPTIGDWDLSGAENLFISTIPVTESTCSLSVPYTYNNVLIPAGSVAKVVTDYSGVGKLTSTVVIPNPVAVEGGSGTDNSFTISPNPTENIVHFRGFNGNYSISDMLGNDVMKGNGNAVDLSNQPSGVYFIHIDEKVYRVVKK